MSAPTGSGGVLAVLDEVLAFASRGVDRDDPAREMIEAGHEARATVEAMAEALKAYQRAGFGNSTDFHAQGRAYDLATEVLARFHGAKS